MTSKLTRERLQEIAEDGFLKHGESKELARMALAALESSTVTFKLPSTPEPSAFAPWVAKAFYQFHRDTVKSCFAVFSDACAAAGIKVEAE